MTVIIVALLVTILIVVAAIFFVVVEGSLILKARDVDHAKCISHIAHYTGNHFAAKVLRAAADHYAEPEGQYELAVLIQSRNGDLSGPPIPSLWMRNRAQALVDEVES